MYNKRHHHRIEVTPRAAEVYLGEDDHWHVDLFGPERPFDHRVCTDWHREDAVVVACAFVNGAPVGPLDAATFLARWAKPVTGW